MRERKRVRKTEGGREREREGESERERKTEGLRALHDADLPSAKKAIGQSRFTKRGKTPVKAVLTFIVDVHGLGFRC